MPEYRNPNQTGGGSQDNRGFMVMMIVMIGLIAGLQFWRAKHNPQTASPADTAATAPASSSTPSPVASAIAPGAPVTAETVQAAAETTTVVQNELYKITFSNRGGEVRSWILKRYQDTDGQPLDLVHDGAAKLYGYPLSLYTYDPAITKALASGLYVASATGNVAAPASVTFKYAAGDLQVTKTFSFGADYVVHADTQVLRNGSPIAAPLAWPAGFGDQADALGYANATIDTSSKGKDEHIAFKKVSGGATLNGPWDYLGVADQYFSAVFLPDNVDDASLVTFSRNIDINKVVRHNGVPTVSAKKPIEVPVIGAAMGAKSGRVQTRIFVGPKDWAVLTAVQSTSGEKLTSLIDFGMWGPISKALFLGMRAVHSAIAPANPQPGNWSWGWAIVVFTILINLLMLPLRIKGMKSMLKMQRLQPEINAIKARHGNPGPTDPKAAKMNAEVMALQKENGVSMFGGCIPTLLTLPLLFAMLTMMQRVVELRHAHFFWLHDLSAGDPYHILPIILALSSFLVQFYTPSPGVDPAQARMMAFTMPLFSLYMTWNYASGLALYWNIGNLIMILQQQVTNRTSLGKEMRAVAEKNAKSKATGKTIQAKPQTRR
ncbi:membrane protein insertase YidC [Granulicella cerasi]|uniref:Membrane protein insertase YidC n=1 Tax=Granulicella cerasi TaxID=741063 RepID=A0ABW1ZAZ1_9BACT|nr:membrane protein insertase YidC [Granulicella cerasi]